MYQLVAFDMDGTLLNSNKEITEESKAAIQKAAMAGKSIAISTGRSIAEVRDTLEILPQVRYVSCTGGAMAIDTEIDQVIYSKLMDVDTMCKMMEIAKLEDIFVQIQHMDNIIQKDKWELMPKYGIAPYQEMFDKVALKWDNIIEEFLENPFATAKMNFYHADLEARERTRRRILDAGIPVSVLNAEITGLEFTASGADKGEGLKNLCKEVNIPMEQVIAVGDADNDIAALKAAGLGIAMGNANDGVKAIADVIVADCDHEGCAEVVEKYLL